MSRFLGITRSLVYYHLNKEESKDSLKTEELLEETIKEIFRKSKNAYGSRKIKVELEEQGIIASRRKICKAMKKHALVSSYTVKQYKIEKNTCNNKEIKNKVDRYFDNRPSLEACVSDLTYVRVGNDWNYICSIIDLHNREIIGYSVGKKKSAQLVKEAIYSIRYPLSSIRIFHTDRGREFDNKSIDKILDIFGIERSLSKKGSPYDNAVAEAFNKVLKTEFVYKNKFKKLNQLRLELSEYIYWYNNLRIHGSLDYLSSVEYRQLRLASVY